jgi:hypothetical protein
VVEEDKKEEEKKEEEQEEDSDGGEDYGVLAMRDRIFGSVTQCLAAWGDDAKRRALEVLEEGFGEGAPQYQGGRERQRFRDCARHLMRDALFRSLLKASRDTARAQGKRAPVTLFDDELQRW